MRRIRINLLLDILAGMLLVVALLTTWLWIESHRHQHTVSYRSAHKWQLLIDRGYIVYQFDRNPSTRFPNGFEYRKSRKIPKTLPSMRVHLNRKTLVIYRRRPSLWNKLGFYDHSIGNGATLVIPHWSVLVVTLIFPISWLPWRIRRYIRLKRLGLCPNCGYDLRMSSDKCPECGQPVAIR